MKIPKIRLSGVMASAGIAGLIVLGVVSGFQLKVLSAEKGTAGSLSSRDYKFVCDAAEGGTLEVSLGQLATQQAGAQSVRDFGQRMVTDHQKADQELMQIIGQKGATLPDTSEKDSKTLEHYRKLAGTTFDSDYIKMMVSDHKKDVKVFQTEADKGEDPDVRGWAAKTFPTLQEHLSLAESTEASVNAMKP